MDKVLLYANAVLNVVATCYPVSLPSMSALLKEEDAFIASLGVQAGLSPTIADHIMGNYEVGVVLRRVCDQLEEVFGEVSIAGQDTKYTFRSGTGRTFPVMSFYPISTNQNLMNCYLKEELYSMLKQFARIRVVLDEMVFMGEQDELLHDLFQMKRQGKIELIVVTKNAKESLPGMFLDFENVVLFQHYNPMHTEELSKELFGEYPHYFPASVRGKPPSMLFTFKNDIHWQITSEQRLRVRAVDLGERRTLFGSWTDYLAVKTGMEDAVHILPANVFLTE